MVKELTRKMKDSGVEWIGEIPEDWEVVRNKNLFGNKKEIVGNKFETTDRLALTLNGVIDRDKFDSEGLQPTNFDTYQKVYKNNLIFKLIDLENINTSRVGLAHKDGMVSPAYVVLHSNNKKDMRFYHYFYLSMWHRNIFNMLGDGGVRSNLNKTDLLNLNTLRADYNIQKAIADFLDKKTQEIDNIISKTKKAIEEYKRYKQSLITETVTKGLDKDVEMKDSGIEWVGEIPEHWRITRLKYYLENVKNAIRVGPFGSHLKGEDFVNEGLWVYNQRTVLDRNFETNDTFITAEKYNDMIGFGVEAKDILVTTRGSIGKICRVPEQFEKGIIHPCIIKFKLDDSKFNYRILELIFNESDFVRKQFVILSNSTTIDVIYSETLKNILVPAIPINEQKAIVSYLDKKCSQIDNIISTKEKLLREMEAYKKSLIYETVTGKREVE